MNDAVWTSEQITGKLLRNEYDITTTTTAAADNSLKKMLLSDSNM